MDIQQKLMALQDATYKSYAEKFLPNINPDTIIGVRISKLRKFVKKYFKTADPAEFMNSLPHKYLEENLIHVILISQMKDYNTCINSIKKFLPYVDNWEVTDAFCPKVFRLHKRELEPEILKWLKSDNEYIIRFGLLMLMKYCLLDKDFDKKYLQWAAAVKHDNYYAKMMLAWFFTTALYEHYKDAIVYLEDCVLDRWVHRKTIVKACDSTRFTDAQKEYLKSLRY